MVYFHFSIFILLFYLEGGEIYPNIILNERKQRVYWYGYDLQTATNIVTFINIVSDCILWLL
jgi:hypothetical protein